MGNASTRKPGFRKVLCLSARWVVVGAAATWTWWCVGERWIFSRHGPNVLLWIAVPVLTPIVAGCVHRSWWIGIATALLLGALWASAIALAAASGALGVV